MAHSAQEQIAQLTNWLSESSSSVLGPGYQVAHKYFGYELPYRWEIRSHQPRWRWTLTLNHAEVLYLFRLSEERQREFLCARLRELVGG
jgi:hypothetical protein